MAKPPTDPKEIFREIIVDYKDLFGDDLISIILYGSATGKGYRPGKSDINFMIVLSEDGIEHLDRAFAVVAKWQRQKVAIPLIITEGYLESSMDVFPIEYLNVQRNHVLVYGKDVMKGLAFDREWVRLQCEREIKGKLLLLREAFLETAGKGNALRGLIARSIEAFIALFEALLYLKEEEIPREKREVLRAACEGFAMDGDLFEKLLDIKEGKGKLDDAEISTLFQGYLKEASKLSKIVDAWGGGDN